MHDVERRQLDRERRARKEAERLLEEKSAELYAAQEIICRHNEVLEATVHERTKQLEQALARAEESDRLKSHFVANVSHELRTPLNVVIGYTDILLESGVYDRELLQLVRANAVVLNDLVNDVLDFSRLRAQKLPLNFETIEVTDILGEIERNISVLCRARGLRLECRAQPGAIVTDPIRLRQILLNLVTNAIKFTPQGSVNVTAAPSEGGWCLAVRDTGVGIAEADRERIFAPFEQAGRGGLEAGAGLGLAIVHDLVTLLGGRIVVESTPGRGSTFAVWLPDGGLSEP